MTLTPSSLIRRTDSTTAQSQTPQLPQQTLGQADFLKLLVTQLSAQDPMNPMQDTQFVAQMAQFTTLQQTQNMQQNLAGLQAGQTVLQASALLGRTVQVLGANGQVISGPVTSIGNLSGTPTLVVQGQNYALNQVISVSAATTQH